MTTYIIVAMFFYVANGVSDMLTANGEQRKAIPHQVGFLSFIIQLALFIWGAYLLA